MFEVGQMALCVDAQNRSGYFWPAGGAPEAGRIYTVRSIVTSREGKPALHFDELRRSSELPYHAYRFRPVRKTSIEELRKLVAPVPRQPVPAE